MLFCESVPEKQTSSHHYKFMQVLQSFVEKFRSMQNIIIYKQLKNNNIVLRVQKALAQLDLIGIFLAAVIQQT